MSTRPPMTCPPSWRTSLWDWKAWTTRWCAMQRRRHSTGGLGRAARGRRLAAGGVRRRDRGGGRGAGTRRHAGPGNARAAVPGRGRCGCAWRPRPTQIWRVRESALGRGRARQRRAPDLGGMGRLGRAAGTSRRVPARLARPAGHLPLSRQFLRTLRPGVRAHADRFRPVHGRRRPDVPTIRDRGGRPGLESRRLHFWRTWRRAGARRASGPHVLARDAGRIPRVQAPLGSRPAE